MASRKNNKSRRSPPFLRLPNQVHESEQFGKLSGNAVKLLIHIAGQYRGKNNGDLSATWTQLESRGWKSRSTLHRSLKELVEAGFIELTRQGGLHTCSLYAITWEPINECSGKLDVLETTVASNRWKNAQ